MVIGFVERVVGLLATKGDLVELLVDYITFELGSLRN